MCSVGKKGCWVGAGLVSGLWAKGVGSISRYRGDGRVSNYLITLNVFM